MQNTSYEQNILGFTGCNEIVCAMFKPKQVNLKNIILITMGFLFITSMVPFLEKWIWSPFWTLIFFYFIVLWDFVSAIAVNHKKEGFVTSKAKKVPIVLVAYTMLFASLHLLSAVIVAFNMQSMLNPDAFKYLAKGVFFLCVTINFLSALKHMSILGLIPKQVANFISRFIDVHKNKVTTTLMNPELKDGEPDNQKPPQNTPDNGII